MLTDVEHRDDVPVRKPPRRACLPLDAGANLGVVDAQQLQRDQSIESGIECEIEHACATLPKAVPYDVAADCVWRRHARVRFPATATARASLRRRHPLPTPSAADAAAARCPGAGRSRWCRSPMSVCRLNSSGRRPSISSFHAPERTACCGRAPFTRQNSVRSTSGAAPPRIGNRLIPSSRASAGTASGRRENGRGQIHRDPDLARDPARRDPSGPAEDRRHADAALPHASLCGGRAACCATAIRRRCRS